MPRINWDDVEDSGLIPEGIYLAKVNDIEQRYTTAGEEYWRLTLEILEGKYSGRFVYDSLFFSQKAIKRVKLAVSRLGVKTEGDSDLETEDLLEKKAAIEVIHQDSETRSGEMRTFAQIPYEGYFYADEYRTRYDKYHGRKAASQAPHRTAHADGQPPAADEPDLDEPPF